MRFLVTPVLILLTACAHTPRATDDAELIRLRERVSLLERKLGDVDAKLAVLIARAGDDGMSEIVVGGSVDYSPPPPRPRAREYSEYDDYSEPERAPRRAQRPEPEPEPEPEIEVRASPVGSADVDALYKFAMNSREAGRHKEAVSAFNDIITRFPEHHLADNALYWSAVCHKLGGDERKAIETWRSLPLRFPRSPKMPDALFGMAQSHEALGEPVLAETLYAQLIEQYPRAENVASAREALARLRPGG